MSEECFITSDHDKGSIERVGKNYLIIKDIYTDEEFKFDVDESIAEHFKNECSDGEVVYVLYDKLNQKLI